MIEKTSLHVFIEIVEKLANTYLIMYNKFALILSSELQAYA